MSGLVTTLVHPLYGGGGTSAEVPGKWDLALNGRTFMFDTKYFGSSGRQRRSSVQLLKPQQDNSGEISERSLNPEDLIRQAQEMWHKGAGQVFFDRADSDSARFRSSKGIDVFSEKFKFSLLPATDQKSSSVQTVMAMVVAGSRLYRIDGANVEWTADVTVDTPVWTAVTGLPGAAVALASDGFYVYIACSGNGIYRTDTTTNAAASYITGATTLVAWVKGRLMAAGGSSIYNPTAAGALPAALNSSLNTGITWVGFAEGPNHIYAAGYTGSKSFIYKTTIVADGTSLGAPSVAAQLPEGEIVRSVYGYLGYLFIGTDKGVWIARPDAAGNLTLNKVLATTSAVQCFEGQDRFVWFGYTNYDTTSSGLGRMDLGTDVAEREVLTPAYASDLMATAQGAVLAVVTFQARRVFAVSGAGFWGEDTVKVASGSLQTGLITYDLADNKISMYLTVTHEALVGTVAAGLAVDGALAFSAIGSNTDTGSVNITLPTAEERGESFEVEFTLTRSATDTTAGPKVTRWVLESNPAPGRGEFFDIAILLYRVVEVRGESETIDVAAAYEALLEMEQGARPLTYQDGWGTETVFLDDHEFITDSYDSDGHQGTFLARLRRPRRRSI